MTMVLVVALSATLALDANPDPQAGPTAPAASAERPARPLTHAITTYVERTPAQDEFHSSELTLTSTYVRYEARPARGRLTRLAFGGEIGLHDTAGSVRYFGDPTTYESDTFGASVGAFARLYALDRERVDLFVEGSAGFIRFGAPFPPNGTVLNGLLRYGGGVRVGLTPRLAVEAGLRHTHISNGMGLVPLNPSFDGNGVFAGLRVRF